MDSIIEGVWSTVHHKMFGAAGTSADKREEQESRRRTRRVGKEGRQAAGGKAGMMKYVIS